MRAVSDLELERFLVDDLDAEDAARVAKAIADDDVLAQHIAARRAQQTAWSARAKPLSMSATAAATTTAMVATPSWLSRLLSALQGSLSAPALVASAACVFAFVAIDVGNVGDGDTGGAVRARGVGDVGVVVKRGEQTFRFAGQPLREGDALRLRVDAMAGAGQNASGDVVSVVAVDVHGAVSVVADRVGVDGDGYVGGSFILDDNVGAERWFVLQGPANVVAADAAAGLLRGVMAGHQGDEGDLRRRLESSRPGVTLGLLTFEKESPP